MPWLRSTKASMTRPNPTLTPGAYGTTPVPRDVPTALKRAVFKSYGIGLLRRPFYVIDHLVPLELCGLNTQPNLWPQPRGEAKLKDRDEFRLAAAVHMTTMTLADAQAQMLQDWGGRPTRAKP